MVVSKTLCPEVPNLVPSTRSSYINRWYINESQPGKRTYTSEVTFVGKLGPVLTTGPLLHVKTSHVPSLVELNGSMKVAQHNGQGHLFS